MKQKTTLRNTLGMFDLLKGVTMILIVYFHSKSLFPMLGAYQYTFGEKPLILDLLLYALYGVYSLTIEFLPGAFMPALMIVGGYGYRKRTIGKAFSNHSKELVLPYLYTIAAAVVVHFCLHFLFYRGLRGAFHETVKLIGGMALGFSQTTEIGNLTFYSNGPVWYLLTMFWALLFFNILNSRFDGKGLLFSSFAVSMVGWLLSYFPFIPFCLAQGLVSILYIYFGYYLKEEKYFLREHSRKDVLIWVIGVIVPNIVLSHMKLYTSLALNQYSLGPVTYIENGLLGVLLIYVFLTLNVCRGKISGFLRTIGRYSLYVVCVHTVDMVAVPWYLLADRFAKHPYVGSLIIFLVRLVIIFVVCLGLVKLSNYKKKQKYAKRKSVQA